MTTTKSDAPVLQGHRSPEGTQILVWCQYCEVEHCHGRHHGDNEECAHDSRRPLHSTPPCTCPTGTGDGHRTAHCHDYFDERTGQRLAPSPYKRTGYVVVEVDP